MFGYPPSWSAHGLHASGANVRFPPLAAIRIDADALHGHAGLMSRHLLISVALVVALLVGWLAWDGWFYLQRGYSLGVSIRGHPGSVFHIDFPMWREAVHIFLLVAAMAAIVAYVTSWRWASTAAWLSFAATLVIGIYDVVQYGAIGSPTSIWTVLLLLFFALLTMIGPLASKAKA